MSWVTYAAIYFILWWTFLFAVLPIGLRTQDDDENVTLGTASSAPRGPHMLRACLWTTVATTIVMALIIFAVERLGFGFDSFPNFLPN